MPAASFLGAVGGACLASSSGRLYLGQLVGQLPSILPPTPAPLPMPWLCPQAGVGGLCSSVAGRAGQHADCAQRPGGQGG